MLRGSFALLRHLQMHRPVQGLALSSAPKIKRRLLNHWDNMDGTVERGYAGRSLWSVEHAAGDDLPALQGLRARERVHRHQRGRAQQRQRQRPDPDRRESGQGGRAGDRVSPLRDHRLPHGAIQRAHRDRRPHHRRSARRQRQAVVDDEGERDLHEDPRLRRLPGEGQLRGTAGTAELRPHARRRRQDAVRRAGPQGRHRDVARLRLHRQRHRPHPPGVRRVQAARRDVRKQRDGAGEERAARLPAARAVQPAVRGDASHAGRPRAADHQGVPRRGHAPRLPRPAVRRGSASPTPTPRARDRRSRA